MRERPSPVNYLVIGHVTHDVLPGGGHTVGGTAAYAAFTAAALGLDVGLLTSAGPELDLAIFRGVATVVCHAATSTTTFRNVYHNGQREQFVSDRALPLAPALLPESWRQVPVVHVGPVIGECDAAWVTSFAGRAFVGVTPQGWMRGADDNGRVHPAAWSNASAILPAASAVVLSIEDLAGDWDAARVMARRTRVLVVTCGADGGTLFVEGEVNVFPAWPIAELDATGAGDIFATAFFTSMASGAKPIAAAHFAACLASRSVARRGLTSVPSAQDVAACPLHTVS